MHEELTKIGKFMYLKVPIDEILMPLQDRICYNPRYWLVTEDNCVLFYNGHSPQCNTNYQIAQTLSDKGLKLEVRLLPMVYLEQSWLGA